MTGSSGPYPARMRCRDPNQRSDSLEHSALASQKVWRERLPPCPGPLRHQQCSDHHPSSSPKSLHSTESLTHSGKLAHLLDLRDTFFCLQLCPASQTLFAFEWKDPHTGRDTTGLDSSATRLQKLTYPVR